MTMPLVYIQTYRVCMLCIVYIHLYTVYLFIYNVNKNKRFSSLVFGTILIGLWWSCYTNTLFPVLPLSVILSPLSHIVCMLMSESNIMAYVNNFCAFSGWLITSHFSSVLIAFDHFFTWIALGDVHLHFSLILVSQCCLRVKYISHDQHNQSVCVTDGTTVMSLFS